MFVTANSANEVVKNLRAAMDKIYEDQEWQLLAVQLKIVELMDVVVFSALPIVDTTAVKSIFNCVYIGGE